MAFKNFTYQSISVLFLFTILTSAYAQKQNSVGINFTSEWTSGIHNRFGLGLLFERQFTTHSGFETGIYLKSYTQEWNQIINAVEYSQKVYEHYISVPILYKYYTRILNVCAGPAMDYYIGWNEKKINPDIDIVSYNITPKFSAGLLMKLGKAVTLGEKLVLEPEIRFHGIFINYKRYYTGFGMSIRYKL